MKLYFSPTSPYVRKCLVTAHELGLVDRIELLPSHIDPTMNLHDVVYALEGDSVVGVWPIAARGYHVVDK